MNQQSPPSDRRVLLISTIAGVVGAIAGVMQWLTSAGAWAVVAVGVIGLAAACWALAWLWLQRRAVLATAVVVLLVAIAAVTGAATDRIVGRPTESAANADPTGEQARVGNDLPTETPSATPPATTGPPPSPSPTPPVPPPAEVSSEPTRSEKDVTLSYRYALDLDSEAENWNVELNGIYGGTDLSLGSGRLFTFGDVVVIDGAPEQARCQNAVTRQRGVNSEQIRVGQSFCIHTSERRWAWITVKRYAPSETITFDVVVW
ncbi:hypothetical protein [Micromonospora sp. WMMD1082]|uniref:hypothetical protein n=1 Tax=Micromonospora sp. WMMD1082 TaxID=3016104 RepID=UPI002417D664|nr:hypothetical protein [Micromonospora sp. WMMD1082]MDG4792629.1 hypothetical protein [Micromonospora sp. WMMD1082]